MPEKYTPKEAHDLTIEQPKNLETGAALPDDFLSNLDNELNNAFDSAVGGEMVQSEKPISSADEKTIQSVDEQKSGTVFQNLKSKVGKFGKVVALMGALHVG